MARPGAVVAALVLAAALGALLWHEHSRADREHAANLAAADTLRLARLAARTLDSSLAASAAADSARRAGQDSAVAHASQQAVRTGATVTRLTHRAAAAAESLPCPASPALDTLRATLAQADTALRAHLAADTLAAAADSTRHAGDVARIDFLQTSAIPTLKQERNDALDRAERNLARAIAAEHGWSTGRRILTAVSCAAAGVGAVKGNAPVGLGGGAVCVGSLALR